MPRQILKINKDDTSTEEAVFCLRAHTHTLPRLLHACASLIALDPCSFSPTLRPGTSLAPAGVVVAYVNRAACCVSCSPRRNELLSGAEAVPRTRCTHMGMSKLKRDRGREICIYPQVLRGRQRGERSSFIVSLQRIGGTSYFAPIPRVGSQLLVNTNLRCTKPKVHWYKCLSAPCAVSWRAFLEC